MKTHRCYCEPHCQRLAEQPAAWMVLQCVFCVWVEAWGKGSESMWEPTGFNVPWHVLVRGELHLLMQCVDRSAQLHFRMQATCVIPDVLFAFLSVCILPVNVLHLKNGCISKGIVVFYIFCHPCYDHIMNTVLTARCPAHILFVWGTQS